MCSFFSLFDNNLVLECRFNDKLFNLKIIHRSGKRQASMNKENEPTEEVEEPTGRITRARYKALRAAGGICSSSKPSFKQEQKRVLRLNSKRAASDENKASVPATVGLQPKRRAVLKNVTNVGDDTLYMDCTNATKNQITKQTITDHNEKNTEMFEDIAMEIPSAEEDVKAKLADSLSKIRMVETQEITLPVIPEERELLESKCCAKERATADAMPPKHVSAMDVEVQSHQKIDQKEACKKLGASKDVVDIDSNLKDPQACGLYAPDIYNNMRVTEVGGAIFIHLMPNVIVMLSGNSTLVSCKIVDAYFLRLYSLQLNQRPSTNYMEQLQRDITPSMRGILVDWLVEVSEEYKLVPDTLYLTVSLIDRFLSHNFIEKQRLQLLGVACMLIAS
ncbi:hypothetical protein Gotur_014521 [Gossypium turneri]